MSGLEIVGAVASIAQLAGTVYAISKTLYEVSDALSNAPSDIQDLAHDLETFSQELNLLYKLLENKNSRYSDEVHRLMAKIIGDCATVCVKIDKILRKLRTGSVMARIKWVFKEKEIVKLLSRLRDLKLSLLHVLSMSHTFEADVMIDALRVHNPSLLVGSQNEQLSKETMDEVEATRRKLAGISVGQTSDTNLRRPPSTLTSDSSQESWGSSQTNLTDETVGTSISVESSSWKNLSDFPLTSTTAFMSSGTVTGNPMPFISTMAIPQESSVFRMTQAMDSVQSFHSAVSYLEHDSLSYQDTSEGSSKDIEPTGAVSLPQKNQSVIDDEQWKASMIASTMKRFNISHSSAKEWVLTLQRPALATNAQYGEMDFSISNPIPSPLEWHSQKWLQSDSTNQNLAFMENGPEKLQAQPNSQASNGLAANQAAELASQQKMHLQQKILQQQQEMQIQRQRAQAARQAMLAQQYTGIQPGMPYGINQMTPAQFQASRGGGPMARPVDSPENIYQQEAQQQSQVRAQSQQIGGQRGPGGMGSAPMPPLQSPAMNVLNCPISRPSQPINHQTLQVNQLPGQPMDTYSTQEIQDLTNPQNAGSNSGMNSAILAQISPEQRQRLMNLSPEKYHEVIRRFEMRYIQNQNMQRAQLGVAMQGTPQLQQQLPGQFVQNQQPTQQRPPLPQNVAAGMASKKMRPSSVDAPPAPLPQMSAPGAMMGSPPSIDVVPRSFEDMTPNEDFVANKFAEKLLARASDVEKDKLWVSIKTQVTQQQYDAYRRRGDAELLLIYKKQAWKTLRVRISEAAKQMKAVQAVPLSGQQSAQNPAVLPNKIAETSQLESIGKVNDKATFLPYLPQHLELELEQRNGFRCADQNPRSEASGKAPGRKRTKTGCLTCRRRRIRCGEEKPTCQNCAMSDRQCNGYNQRVCFKPPLGAPYEPSGCYTAVEMNKNNAVLITATVTPSATKLAELWWRGFAKLQDTEPESSEGLAAAWNQSRRYFHMVYAASEESPSDEHVAVLAVHELTHALAIIPVDPDNEALPGRAKSVGRISDIIRVIQDTLKFKLGAIAWVCLGQAVLVCTRWERKSLVQIVLSHLADIVTLIARYNVMESMYQQWPNMSLEKNYEDSLVDLCVHVLRYLNRVITMATLDRAEDAEQKLSENMKRIEEADDRCRGFKVTIIEASMQRGTKRSAQDVEDDDSDDSNDNENGVEEEGKSPVLSSDWI
ncbi:hypothetical protein BP6252_06014 [Coleophoma cylindrospora]|uniref:Zn(2)-C6 fungal-type domain-containing protein n=1 Tax=Coleophoma cylindrospora TaxID=1849047 RepID=A0A3D8RLA3_9HELO|nr:hypothetical protein BP6252_06014 [Coleophoma cylindrospora]